MGYPRSSVENPEFLRPLIEALNGGGGALGLPRSIRRIVPCPPFRFFAAVYPDWCDELRMPRWVAYNLRLARRHGFLGGRVLDLGCGAGLSTFPVAESGYRVTGVDRSAEMLRIARQRALGYRGLRFLHADITDPGLLRGERFSLVLANFDVINYLTRWNEVRACFRNVRRLLGPGGIFLFDLVTEHNYRTILDGDVRLERHESGAVLLRELYQPSRRLWRGEMAILVPWDGGYILAAEEHRQRCHPPGRVEALLRRLDFDEIHTYTTQTLRPAAPRSERLTFVARRA